MRAYRNSLSLPLRLVGVDLSDWGFEEVRRAVFNTNPLHKRFPHGNLDKVLELLRDHPRNDLEFLEKTLFLTALASGNRMSELAALFERIQCAFRRKGFIWQYNRDSYTRIKEKVVLRQTFPPFPFFGSGSVSCSLAESLY